MCKRNARCIVAVLVLLCPLPNPDSWARAQPSERAAIRGRVTDSFGGPLPGALVHVRTCDGSERSGTSSADGSYDLGETDIGCDLAVSVRCDGFDTRVMQVIAGTYGTHLDVGLDVTLMFAKAPRLSGRVVAHSGAPIAGATIAVQAVLAKSRLTVRSGSSGDFAVPIVQPGPYTVSVVKSGYRVEAKVVYFALLKEPPTTMEFRLTPLVK